MGSTRPGSGFESPKRCSRRPGIGRGLIREDIAHPNKVFYDANTSPHYHFYHVETGELTDIAPADLPIVRLPQLPDGTVAEGVDIVVRVRSAGKA
jgi:Fur family iron response transcriptional regulator